MEKEKLQRLVEKIFKITLICVWILFSLIIILMLFGDGFSQNTVSILIGTILLLLLLVLITWVILVIIEVYIAFKYKDYKRVPTILFLVAFIILNIIFSYYKL